MKTKKHSFKKKNHAVYSEYYLREHFLFAHEIPEIPPEIQYHTQQSCMSVSVA